MKFRNAVLTAAVLMVLALASVGYADETEACSPPFNLDLGTFASSDGAYFAWTAALSQDRWTVYAEQDMKSSYDLWIGTYRVDDRGDKAVIRIDDGKVRVGVFAPIAAGFTGRLIAGDGPTRLDVWTPCLPIAKAGSVRLSVSGWFRAHEDNPPDFWVCPTLNWGAFSAMYEYNLRSSGGDFWSTNYRISF